MDMVSSVTESWERTRMAEVRSWAPLSLPDCLFLMYDVGGHESYKSTTHAFQVATVLLLLLSAIKGGYFR